MFNELALMMIMMWPAIPMFLIELHFAIGFWRKIGLWTYLFIVAEWLPIGLTLYAFQNQLLYPQIVLGIPFLVLGIVLIVLALILHGWTAKLIGLKATIGYSELKFDASQGPMLVTSGPFSVVRHPSYWAHTAIMTGILFITGVVSIGIIALVDLAINYFITTTLEDRELVTRFGDIYIEYQKRVPKFFPKLKNNKDAHLLVNTVDSKVITSTQESRMEAKKDAEKLYNDKASLYQKVFIDCLNWEKELDRFFRKTDYLQSNMKILDAGCGTGAVTKTLYQIINQKGDTGIQFYGFDLTENMLKIFKQWIISVKANNIELAKADVLYIESLPIGWNSFDLIVSSTMLEYLPRDNVKDALSNLKKMLKDNGKLIVIITKRNLLTKGFADTWWKANLYNKAEIKQAFVEAGFERIRFRNFSFGWSSAIIVIEGENSKTQGD